MRFAPSISVITWLTLVFILVLAFWLRANDLQTVMMWGDPGRDIMVAKRIAESGERLSVGPIAAGGHNLLHNSPFYYYVVAGLWWLTPSPVGVAYAFVLFGVATCGVAFLIGREIADENAGLVAAFLVAVSQLLMYYSQSVFQPFLMPLVSSLCLYFLVKALKQVSLTYTLLSITFLFLGLHLHYSILPLVPVVLGWCGWVVYKKYVAERKSRTLLLPGLVVLGQIALWLLVTTKNTVLESVYFIGFQLLQRVQQTDAGPTVNSNPFGFLEFLFPEAPVGWSVAIFLFIVGGLGWRLYRRYLSRLSGGWPLFLLTCWLSVGSIALYSKAVLDVYSSPYYPLTLIILAYLIIKIALKNLTVAVIITWAVVVMLHPVDPLAVNNTDRIGEYDQARIVAETIAADYRRLNFTAPDSSEPPRFTVKEKTNGLLVYDWGAPSFWYFLEIIFDQQLVTTTPLFNNITPLVTRPTVTYFICRDYYPEEESVLKDCLKPFILYYSPYATFETLIPAGTPQMSLVLFRLQNP